MQDRQENTAGQNGHHEPAPVQRLPLVPVPSAPPAVVGEQWLSVHQMLSQVAIIQQVMGSAMKDGEHFGRIPGCGDKPTLLKPGAEKLCLLFRMAPTYEIDERNLDGGQREYRVQCTLSSILTGNFLGQGVGTCSTMEGKYRYRAGVAEVTDKPVPRAYWDTRGDDPALALQMIGGKGFTVKKVEGRGWFIAKGGDKVENDNPADCYNTVLKMGKKRALVDAVLTATAASDIFTQDLEDLRANMDAHTAPAVSGAEESKTPGGLESDPAGSRGNGGSPSSGAHASAPVAASHAPAPSKGTDFRETRIHFGKNRGLMLSELSPQQVHWYETDWMPKKEVNGPTSVEDLAFIDALKAYRAWRSNHQSASTHPRGGKTK